MDKSTQDEIKYLYVNYVSPQKIATEFKITYKLLWRHAIQFEWNDLKIKNTKNRYIEISSTDPRYFTGADILRATENIDKLSGVAKSTEEQLLEKLDTLTNIELTKQLKELESRQKENKEE